MNVLHLGLILLWGLSFSSLILITLIIDSYDCSQFNYGWDKLCLENNEYHKEKMYQTMPIATIILSVVMIVGLYKPKTNSQ